MLGPPRPPQTRPPPGPEPREGKWVSVCPSDRGGPSISTDPAWRGVRVGSWGAVWLSRPHLAGSSHRGHQPEGTLSRAWRPGPNPRQCGRPAPHRRRGNPGPSLLSRGRSRGPPRYWALGCWAATLAPCRSRGGHWPWRDARVPAAPPPSTRSPRSPRSPREGVVQDGLQHGRPGKAHSTSGPGFCPASPLPVTHGLSKAKIPALPGVYDRGWTGGRS